MSSSAPSESSAPLGRLEAIDLSLSAPPLSPYLMQNTHFPQCFFASDLYLANITLLARAHSRNISHRHLRFLTSDVRSNRLVLPGIPRGESISCRRPVGFVSDNLRFGADSVG